MDTVEIGTTKKWELWIDLTDDPQKKIGDEGLTHFVMGHCLMQGDRIVEHTETTSRATVRDWIINHVKRRGRVAMHWRETTAFFEPQQRPREVVTMQWVEHLGYEPVMIDYGISAAA